MTKMSVSAAIREGMREEMQRDGRVIQIGEDLGVMGSPFVTGQVVVAGCQGLPVVRRVRALSVVRPCLVVVAV